MLQFYNRILPKCGFVDLHNHTNDSYGEEMNQMNITPEELLESAYEYTKQTSSDVTFAITDHNSIEGVQKVDLLLKSNPKKYDKINFISGCEFTCSAGSLGEITNDEGHIKNIYSNFHMLAYGFNAFDETLSFLCKLHSTKRANSVLVKTDKATIKISAGAYVLSIKNILKDYGIILSLEDFKDVNLKTDNIDEKTYINYLMTYIEKFKLEEMVKKDIFYQLCNRNIISLGRLDCLEVMEVVESAGGVCVLAHPFLIRLGTFAKDNEKKTMALLKRKLKKIGEKFNDDDNVYILSLKYIVSKLSKHAHSLDNNKRLKGIVGIENLHFSSTLHSNFFERVNNIAKENNLYITCGSDSHGSLKAPNMLSMFTAKSELTNNVKNDIVAKNCLFAEKLLDGSIKNDLKCNKSFDEQITLVQNQNNKDNVIKLQDYCNLIINTSVDRPHTSKKQNHENKEKNIEFSKVIYNGKTNINTAIFLITRAIDKSSTDKSILAKEFKNIKALVPSINLALETISKNKEDLKDKKYVINFLKLYQNYLKVRKKYKLCLKSAQDEYKQEKKKIRLDKHNKDEKTL